VNNLCKEYFLFKLAGKDRDSEFLQEGERVEIGDWKSNNVSVNGREESTVETLLRHTSERA
jgi:hypothetical protein